MLVPAVACSVRRRTGKPRTPHPSCSLLLENRMMLFEGREGGGAHQLREPFSNLSSSEVASFKSFATFLRM